MHAHGGPVGLLQVQGGREQRAVRATGGDLVALHRGHDRSRTEQAHAGDLRRVAIDLQAQGMRGHRRGSRQPALLAAAGLRIVCKVGPSPLCVLRLQACGAVRAGPFNRQAGGRQGVRQCDVEHVAAGLAGGNGDGAAALPQRRCLGRIQSGNPEAGARIQRLQFEDGHAPVGGALWAGQAQVAGLARGEGHGFDAAQRIAHGVRGLPLRSVQRGLQAVALGIGDIPGHARPRERSGLPQIDLEPVSGAEGAAGDGLGVVIDQVTDGHGRDLLGGTAGLPVGPFGQVLGEAGS